MFKKIFGNKEKKQAQSNIKSEKKTKQKKQPDDSPSTKEGGHSFVVESKMWYKDQYRNALFLSLILSSLLFVSFLFNIIQFVTEPKPNYFAVTRDLRVQKLTSLEEPYVTQSGLLNWVSNTVTDTLNFDFNDWRKSFMEVRNNYTEKAFEELVTSLKESGILDLVRQKRLVLSSVLQKTPVITAKGMYQGKMAWKIEVPVLLSYESSEGVENTQNLIADILVHRVPVTEHPRGIKINQIIVE